MSAVMRFWLRFSAWASLILALPILLIHTQPNDAQTVRDRLTAPDCAASCFMGIRPGQTSLDDAFVLLNAHPWVAVVGADYRQFAESNQNTDLSLLRFVTGWQWSRNVPGWIDTNQRANLGVVGSEISSIGFYSTLPLGEIILAYGPPDVEALLTFGDNATQQYHIYRLFYRAPCMWVQGSDASGPRERYHWPAQIVFQSPDRASGDCAEPYRVDP